MKPSFNVFRSEENAKNMAIDRLCIFSVRKEQKCGTWCY
jgi:hypothetical protein